MVGEAARGWMPNYKPMAQIALRRRVGRLYLPFLVAAAGAIALRQIADLALAAGRSIRSARLGDDVCLLPTVPSNRALILDAIAQAPASEGPPTLFAELTPAKLASAIGVRGVLRCALAIALLYGRVLSARSGRRFDLLLHMRDATALALLTAFAAENPERAVWTDDHYQRWAFLLSNASRRLCIVQHGFLSSTLEFPHRFGTVEMLGVRAERFVDLFAAYFRVERWFLFQREPAAPAAVRQDILLLASSAPHIDEEIAFLTRFRAGSGLPVAVKLHPAHVYDVRKDTLLDLADIVCAKEDRPAVSVFASHSSFMELDYEGGGALTCSIARCGGGEAAAEWLLAELKALG
ncbi:hypothetical protein HZY97_00540 [Sphingomonas sp. R-74633]|uniref:hypothetical protein n=1 Tax=Sphingomonas sp. R-74633 TaxID=2751188 RepID=UPI0015D3F3A0|nr:hypothetical protein [Sphingomonas sp. R-74633]NYT39231.1 hypothetical protein [Sphingomonas sp. R-74633]